MVLNSNCKCIISALIAGSALLMSAPALAETGMERVQKNAPNTCVNLKDLVNTAEAQNVEIRKRDILVLRTGSIPRFYEDEPDAEWNAMSEPGLCYSHQPLDWIAEISSNTDMTAPDGPDYGVSVPVGRLFSVRAMSYTRKANMV